MAKTVKIGPNLSVHCFTPSEIDRIQNINLGRNIFTNNILRKDEKLSRYFNERSMSVLDNYADYEGIKIFITPLENDMFNDVAISVMKENKQKQFPMNFAENEKDIPVFFRELYNRVHDAIHKSEDLKSAQKTKKSKLDDMKMYFTNVADRFHNAKMRILKDFVDSNQDAGNPCKVIADIIEEVHYNELQKIR